MVSNLSKHPYWTGIAGLSGGVAVFDYISRIRDGLGMMESWLGPNWFIIATASPWFKLISFLTMLYCLWRIGTLASKAEIEAEAKNLAIIYLTNAAYGPSFQS